MKNPTSANKVNRSNSESTYIKDPDTDELIDSITYTKRPTETITLLSSEEMESDCPLKNPSYMIDRDSCQMSPLLFESDTDDECSPLKCGQGTPNPTTTAYNINPCSPPTLPPDNVEYFQIFSGLHKLSRMNSKSNSNAIKKSSSEPIMVLDSLNRLSDKTTSEEKVILPRRISRKLIPKQEPVEDELPIPRITRSLVRNEQIATRSKVKTGQINLSNRRTLMHRKKRSPASSKSPHKKSFEPSVLDDDTSLDTPPPVTVTNLVTTLDPDETEMIVPPETIPTLPCTKYDFDISVGPRRNSSVSTDLEIISQKHVFVSLTSSSECPANGYVKSNDIFTAAAMRKSPNMFHSCDSGDEDMKTPSTAIREPFFSKPKPKFFEGLLETSTPVKWSQPLSDSSQDFFWDTSSTLGAVSPTRLRPQLTTREVNTITDDEPKSDIFEITKNDVFCNMIRVTSDSDMSPMRVSEDEEPVVAAAEVEVTTPKRRPSCLDGLTIEKRIKPSTTSTDDISLDDTTAVAPIELSSSDLDCLPSSRDLLQRTPKRTKLPKTIGRRWWSTPRKKTTKARKKRTLSNSSSSVVNAPDIRRWFKKSKDEESPKKASRQRRLDLWFKTGSSPKTTPSKSGLITLSSDEDS